MAKTNKKPQGAKNTKGAKKPPGKMAQGKPNKQNKPHSKKNARSVPTIEKVARLIIPAVLGVASLCAVSLAAIYFTRPAPAQVETATDDREHYNKPIVVPNQPKVDQQVNAQAPPPKEPPSKPIDPPGDKTPVNDATPPPVANNAPPANPPANNAPAETAQTSLSVVDSLYGVTVSGGKFRLGGLNHNLGNAAPQIEKYDGSSFEYLRFNGVDQNLSLPDVPETNGSFVVTARMSARQSVILLDSNQGRLTIRKNRTGIRWKIGGRTKPGPIRNVDKPFDDQQWHQIVMTWQDNGPAVLYVDGVAVDQFDYIHENKRFRDFTAVSLSREAAWDKKFSPSEVQEILVFNFALPPARVSKMFAEKKAAFPNVFNQ